MSKLSAQRMAHAAERMAVYHLDAAMVGIARRSEAANAGEELAVVWGTVESRFAAIALAE